MNQVSKNTIVGFFGVVSLFAYLDIKKFYEGLIIQAGLLSLFFGLSVIFPFPYNYAIGLCLLAVNAYILRKMTKEFVLLKQV